MSRLLLAAVTGATLLLTSAPSVLPAATAAECFTFTDPKDDAVINGDPAGESYDPDLDVLGVGFSATGGTISAAIKVADLQSSSTYFAGDEFTAGFAVAGKYVELVAQRDDISSGAPGTGATKPYTYIYVDTVKKAGTVTATWDRPADTVTISASVADIATAAGVPVANGSQLRNLTVTAMGLAKPDSAARGSRYTLDTALAPYGKWQTVGAGCDPSAVAAPAFDAPKADCLTSEDKKADGTPGHAQAPNDPSLDIVGMAVQTTSNEIRAVMKIDKLTAMPARGNGNRFEFQFKHAGKLFVVAVGNMDAVGKALTSDPNRNMIGTAATKLFAGTGRIDVPSSSVFFTADRASVEEAAGEPMPANLELTEVGGKSVMLGPATQFPADTAPDGIATSVYRLGDNACFKSLAKLTLSPVKVQYGDRAAVSAKLTNAAGGAIAGKAIKFAVGSVSTTATTDGTGVARAQLAVPSAAGVSTMTTSFAGDTAYDDATATTPFTVVAEATKITLSVAKSGTSRTVTATLKEDDGAALRGQKVNWYINGKKVSTLTTDSLGRVILRTAKPTQTVMAEFVAVTGKYTGSKATSKV